MAASRLPVDHSLLYLSSLKSMKLRLTSKLRSAVMAAFTMAVYASMGTTTLAQNAYAEETGKTLHVYILTGQSNSLGAVKGDPASAETQAYYTTAGKGGDEDGILMWNGNMEGSVDQNQPSKNLIVPDEGKTWQTVAPQAPMYSGNNCMGPEYGFAYMMQKKGWNVDDSGDIAIIKGSRDGGGNDQWVKGQPLYNLLLETVKTALKNIDSTQYSSIQLDGLIYLQGESNSSGDGADTKFSQFITDFKADLAAAVQADAELSAKNVSVLLGNEVLGEPATWGNGANGTVNTTGSKLNTLAKGNSQWGFVYTHDLDKITSGDSMGVHYDGNSQITIGARYAYAMAIAQGKDVTEGGTVRVRSQEYGDTFSAPDRAAHDDAARTPISLNEAKAWWVGTGEAGTWTTAELAKEIAVWDVSSANMLHTSQGAETLSGDLEFKGIRIEDPYAEDDTTGTHNATIVIKNAEGADATLTIGTAGIELQRGNLSLQTKVATNGAQTWTVAGGKTLAIGSTIGGTGTISLSRNNAVESRAAAQFDFSSASDTGNRTWNLGDGVEVSLSDTGFAGSTMEIAGGAATTLGGGTVSLGGLVLGDEASLTLASGLSLSAASVSIGSGVSLTFGYTNGQFGSLSAGTLTAGENTVVTVNLGSTGCLSRAEYTLGSGWGGWAVSDGTGSGRQLTLGSTLPAGYSLAVNGNGELILSGTPVYPDVQKAWVQIPEGATVTAAADLVAANSALPVAGSDTAKAVLVNGSGGSSMLLYGGYMSSMGEGKALYTEMQVAQANFISAVGTFSSGNRSTTVKGDYNMKISSASSIASVFAASNITVDGNAYLELSAKDATYTDGRYGAVGAFGADVSGDVTLVINGGTFNSGVNVWGSKKNGSVNNIGDLSIQVNGGSLQNIYVSDANTHNIKSAKVILNGGTVNGSVYGSNTGVNITNGTSIYIGPDAVVKGDVYGGVSGEKSGMVVLHDMAEDAAFLTSFGSGKSIYADNLVLEDTTIGSTFKGTLYANTVTIGSGSTLAADKLSAAAPSTLSGSGTYVLASGTQALSANVSLSEDWAGSVVVSGSMDGLNLDKDSSTAKSLAKEGSTISMDGWTGYFANANQHITANVDIGANGINITNGFSANVQTFEGKFSGTGNFTRTNTSNLTQQFKFTGDVSEFTGAFVNNRCNNSYGLNLTFSDAADTINADFINDTLASGTLDVHFAAEKTTLNGAVVRQSNYPQNKINLTLDDTAKSLSINNTASVSNLNAAGKTVSLGSHTEGETTTHGNLTVEGSAAIGSAELGSGTALTLLNQNADVALVNLSIGDSATASAYKGALPSAAELQQAADGGSSLEATVQVSGKLSAGQDATLNANLVLADGATLSLKAGGLTMGSSVTLGSVFLELEGAEVVDGAVQNYVLFTGVDALALGGEAITESGWYDADELIEALVADGTTLSLADHSYLIGYKDGTVSLTAANATPEPATGTLGLLALAALCARRRRR